MKKSTQKTLIYVAAIVIVAYLVIQSGAITGNVLIPPITINVPESGFNPDAPLAPTDTTPPPSPPPTTPPATGIEPTSLMVSLEPNPVVMGNTLYGEVVSNGKDYPITIHALHVGTATEQTYGGLIGAYGKFYDSNPMTVPGYYDFWVTTDTVTSNKPRITVEGAMITSSKTFWSRLNPFGSDSTATIQVFSHSSGSCLIFTNDIDAATSTPLKTVYINSGGYATTTFDISSFSNGNYELDMVVNGIKASDYGESVFFTVGR